VIVHAVVMGERRRAMPSPALVGNEMVWRSVGCQSCVSPTPWIVAIRRKRSLKHTVQRRHHTAPSRCKLSVSV
jgi:hypothetical protein